MLTYLIITISMSDTLSQGLIQEEQKFEADAEQYEVVANDGCCRRIKGWFNINTWFEVA